MKQKTQGKSKNQKDISQLKKYSKSLSKMMTNQSKINLSNRKLQEKLH
jgi:hypothetical protein